MRAVNLIAPSARDSAALAADMRSAMARLDASLPAVVEPVEASGERLRTAAVSSSTTVMGVFAGCAAARGARNLRRAGQCRRTANAGDWRSRRDGGDDIRMMWMVLRRASTLMGLGLAHPSGRCARHDTDHGGIALRDQTHRRHQLRVTVSVGAGWRRRQSRAWRGARPASTRSSCCGGGSQRPCEICPLPLPVRRYGARRRSPCAAVSPLSSRRTCKRTSTTCARG